MTASGSGTATASCGTKRAIGGGGGSSDGTRLIIFSGPVVSGTVATGWKVTIDNGGKPVTAYAICVP